MLSYSELLLYPGNPPMVGHPGEFHVSSRLRASLDRERPVSGVLQLFLKVKRSV